MNHLGEFDQIIGYSILGAIFLRSSSTQSYLVLYPLRGGYNCKNYGNFNSITEFESKILHDEGFAKVCLHPILPQQISKLSKRLGSLKPDEVYFPVPDPYLGGSGNLNTFKKGNVWVFADIAGQNRGLGGAKLTVTYSKVVPPQKGASRKKNDLKKELLEKRTNTYSLGLLFLVLTSASVLLWVLIKPLR